MFRNMKSPRTVIALFSAVLGVTGASIFVSCKTPAPVSGTLDADRVPTGPLFGGKSWKEEQSARQAAHDAYLKKHPISTDWFVNSPLGVNGVPMVLLLYFMEKYPDIFTDSDGQSKLAFPPHLTDYDASGKLKPASQRRILPLGFAWARDPSVEKSKQTSNVFFSCAGCHTNRVLVDGKMKYFIGGPSNEVEPQLYAGLLWELGQRIFGNPDAVLDAPAGESLSEAVEARAAALVSKANVAAIYADLKKRALGNKLKNAWSYIPGFGSAKESKDPYASKYEYGAQMGPEELQRELAMLTQSLSFFSEVMKGFAGTFIKANVMYKEIGYHLPMRPADAGSSDPEGRKKPGVLSGPKPGQMDAFGLVQGIIVLNAVRPDFSWWKFVEDRYGPDHLLFQGAQGSGEAKYREATKRLAGGAFGLLDRIQQTEAQKKDDIKVIKKWFQPNSANIDIKPLWMSKHETHANWDGNQEGGARALASGVSSVGDPRKVDTSVHALMNPYIDDLPAPPYPFDVDLAKAERGRDLFYKGTGGTQACASCHFANNPKIYNVGTDMNRAFAVSKLARAGLVALTMEACELGMKREGENKDRELDGFKISRDWCATKEKDESDIYRKIDTELESRPEGPIGYKADPLYGIWASSPYLHNGSVPSLWSLFKPSARPARFYRGNVTYNTKDVGYNFDTKTVKYPEGESKHIAEYDTSLRGNNNKGHEDYTAGWSDDQIRDLIEYLKTL